MADPGLPTSYGQVCYDHFRDASGDRWLGVDPAPEWHELPQPVKDAWDAAARGLLDYVDRIPG